VFIAPDHLTRRTLLLHSKFLAEIDAARSAAFNNFLWLAFFQNFAVMNDISPLADAQRLSDIMVRYNHPDPFCGQAQYDVLNLMHRNRINAGKRLIKENKRRRGYQRPGYLNPPALSAGKQKCLALGNGGNIELL
jgi:hypothetical protein